MLTGVLPLLGFGPGNANAGQIDVVMGEQQFAWPTDSGDPGLTGSEFDAAVGAYADEARLGVYLHFLQDRVSHNLCSDDRATATTGPDDAGDYAATFDQGECNVVVHALRHAWEVGLYDPDALAQREQTTEQGLRVTYRELQVFAEQLGVLPVALPSEDALVADLLVVMQTPDPQPRVDAMEALYADWGVVPLPY